MKKSICITLLLAGFSAFAFSCHHANRSVKTAVKAGKKNVSKTGIAPLADLALLPALNG